MKLKDIFEDADLYMPNALSTNHKVRYFNQLQKTLYRDFPTPVMSETFMTEPGLGSYGITVQPEHILNVYIDGKEYSLKTLDDPKHTKGYLFLNGELTIYPTPDSQKEGNFIYKSEPFDVTESDLESEPVFLKDYPEIFVLGIAQKMGLVLGKYKEAGELEIRFQNLVRDASIKTQKGKLKKTRVTRSWS
jgi:hypothetical protein